MDGKSLFYSFSLHLVTILNSSKQDLNIPIATILMISCFNEFNYRTYMKRTISKWFYFCIVLITLCYNVITKCIVNEDWNEKIEYCWLSFENNFQLFPTAHISSYLFRFFINFTWKSISCAPYFLYAALYAMIMYFEFWIL